MHQSTLSPVATTDQKPQAEVLKHLPVAATDQKPLAEVLKHTGSERQRGRRGRTSKKAEVVAGPHAVTEPAAAMRDADHANQPKADLVEQPVDAILDGLDDALRLYFQNIGQTPLLTADQECQLAQAIEAGELAQQQISDLEMSLDDDSRQALNSLVTAGTDARTHMINANLRLVVSIAKKYQGRGLTLLDLVQEGNLGLIRAVGKFDWRKGNKFSTYATWWIRQAITRALADKSRTIRLPVHMNDTLTMIARTEKNLKQALQRDPTWEELADAVGMSPEKLRATLEAARLPTSLQQPVGEEGEGEFGDFVEDDRMPSPVEASTQTLLRDDIEAALGKLPERERKVIRLRYGLNDGKHRTLEEVGKEFGITRERIRQIEAVALRKLRHPAYGKGLRAYLD